MVRHARANELGAGLRACFGPPSSTMTATRLAKVGAMR